MVMKLKVNRSIGWNLEYATMEITQRIHDGADCYPWRKTFALWPVQTIGGRWIWLKPIYKRRFWVVWGTGFHMEPEVEYAELFDILKDD
jgi:hypothetical protein